MLFSPQLNLNIVYNKAYSEKCSDAVRRCLARKRKSKKPLKFSCSSYPMQKTLLNNLSFSDPYDRLFRITDSECRLFVSNVDTHLPITKENEDD